MNNKLLQTLQKVGKALLVPIAIMPAAAILLRLGSPDVVKMLHIPDGTLLAVFFSLMMSAGQAIFDNLPILFAVGVAIGFTENAGVAALSSVVGYYVLITVFTAVSPTLIKLGYLDPKIKINMGVFGGILVGLIVAILYNKYKEIKFPDYLQFFGGKRFIPIATSVTVLLTAVIFSFIWPPIQYRIDLIGDWIVASGPLGLFIYGTLNRLLLAFGLHHILNFLVWFDIGSFTTTAGTEVHGDIARFFAGDTTAGRFMTGFFPIMMFGLPAACLAMIARCRPAKKKILASLLVSAALTSFITGVTEPIEYTFMFIAPFLYLVHALLTGSSLVVCYLLGIRDGFGFSAGLIDYLLSYGIASKPLLLLFVGLCYAVIYYVVFYFLIGAFKIFIPAKDDDDTAGGEIKAIDNDLTNKANNIILALGGSDNIQDYDSCITRLRLKVKDDSKMNDKELKALGALGIIRLGGGGVQIVIGTQAEILCDEMKRTCKIMPISAEQIKTPEPSSNKENKSIKEDLSNEQKEIILYTACIGKVIELSEVPDPVFSQKMMGDGLAIEPLSGEAYAPCDGELAVLFPTNHAYGIKTKEGVEILVHIGINTVEMKGEGMKAHKKQGDMVKKGDLIVSFDIDMIKKSGKHTVTPVLITNMDSVRKITSKATGMLDSKEKVLFKAEI